MHGYREGEGRAHGTDKERPRALDEVGEMRAQQIEIFKNLKSSSTRGRRYEEIQCDRAMLS